MHTQLPPSTHPIPTSPISSHPILNPQFPILNPPLPSPHPQTQNPNTLTKSRVPLTPSPHIHHPTNPSIFPHLRILLHVANKPTQSECPFTPFSPSFPRLYSHEHLLLLSAERRWRPSCFLLAFLRGEHRFLHRKTVTQNLHPPFFKQSHHTSSLQLPSKTCCTSHEAAVPPVSPVLRTLQTAVFAS